MKERDKDNFKLYRCPKCGYEKCFSRYEIGWAPLLDLQHPNHPPTFACDMCGRIMKSANGT